MSLKYGRKLDIKLLTIIIFKGNIWATCVFLVCIVLKKHHI